MFLAIKAIEPFPLTYAAMPYFINLTIASFGGHHVHVHHHVQSLFMYCSILVKDHMMSTMNGGTLRPEPEPIATTKPIPYLTLAPTPCCVALCPIQG